MEDLTTDDVAQYTSDRLDADDEETQRALDEALDRIRAYCGWHVSPVREEAVTLRGDGYPDIALPTKKLVSIESITEDGAPVDLDTVTLWRNSVTRKSGVWRGLVEVTFTHGFTADECAGWRGAVLHLVDQETLAQGTPGEAGQVVAVQVDDVQTRWQAQSFEEIYGQRLAPYRRTWVAV